MRGGRLHPLARSLDWSLLRPERKRRRGEGRSSGHHQRIAALNARDRRWAQGRWIAPERVLEAKRYYDHPVPTFLISLAPPRLANSEGPPAIAKASSVLRSAPA